MVQKYPGLIVKGRAFYFRVGVPRKYWTLAKCKEICYTLDTSDYKLAVARWRTEIAHLQTFMDVFEDIIMKINKENKVILDENDVDKILLARLSQIQYFLEENAENIVEGKKTIEDIKLPTEQRKELMVQMILDYLRSLVENSQANITLRTTYTKLKEKEIELGLEDKAKDGYEWFKSFGSHVSALERYAEKSIKAIKKDKPYNPSNPKVKTLLKSYDNMKTTERLTKSMTKTHWEKFFKKYAQNKKNLKGIPDERIRTMYLSIKLAFLIMRREYIEEITKQDCRKLSEKIYQVPKKWHTEIEKGKTIKEILTKSENKALGKQTIKGYLNVFTNFMRYAVREDIIENNMNDYIDKPIKIEKEARNPFDNSELHKIFNPKTYPSPKMRNNQAKFWVPIIALYHGCRLNEICQLDVTDIVSKKGIPCISIHGNDKDKSVKNKTSERIIPIHPQIIELGFLRYVEFQRKNKAKKLFSELTQIERGRYSNSVQHWFGRYLDKIDITGSDKVFHSFRHTFETKAVEVRIPAEYQNALCGWADRGIGQRLYGKTKDIKVMLEELSKISYPLSKELKEFKTLIQESFYCRK